MCIMTDPSVSGTRILYACFHSRVVPLSNAMHPAKSRDHSHAIASTPRSHRHRHLKDKGVGPDDKWTIPRDVIVNCTWPAHNGVIVLDDTANLSTRGSAPFLPFFSLTPFCRRRPRRSHASSFRAFSLRVFWCAHFWRICVCKRYYGCVCARRWAPNF